MQIYVTKDYSSFRSIVSNREVNKGHVKKLAQSIRKKNLLFIRPVIVNDRMEIIDGQHRVAACEMLGEQVHYIKVNLTKEDIAVLNTAQKNWTMMDFINFYAIEGRKEYREFCKLINKYPLMSVTTLMRLCGNSKNVRQGQINISNISRARQISCWVEQLRNKRLDFVYERNFCLALDEECPDEAAFEHLVGMPKLTELLIKCDSKNEYRKQIKALLRK